MVYDKRVIEAGLARLPDAKRIAFGVMVCERLMPNYLAFAQDVNQVADPYLRHVLDQIWDLIGGKIREISEIEGLTTKCEILAPDSDEYDTLLTAPAQEAVFAVCSVLDYIATKDVSRLVQVSSFAIDTVDMYVQESCDIPPNSLNLEQRIREYPLMQREIKRQLDDLASLEADTPYETLRSRASSGGVLAT